MEGRKKMWIVTTVKFYRYHKLIDLIFLANHRFKCILKSLTSNIVPKTAVDSDQYIRFFLLLSSCLENV